MELIRQLAGMANNLNQIAHRANAAGYRDARTEYLFLAEKIDLHNENRDPIHEGNKTYQTSLVQDFLRDNCNIAEKIGEVAKEEFTK